MYFILGIAMVGAFVWGRKLWKEERLPIGVLFIPPAIFTLTVIVVAATVD